MTKSDAEGTAKQTALMKEQYAVGMVTVKVISPKPRV